ncbi:c-type cytochrome, methanol metabolism-related [Aureimonas altamirensis]|uniref:c-type cytochrome, methanol metabolism-related n=1 Tax=Aureimonas altamirensis TaxID=370622 RepID=UPI0020368EDD|nr:c-type cytochrome, methanol metabolism-related [Aureimonas altamirensis]MCM2502250.1 c-type cytochrome, methanol metabolism-related [Aureimonas altamirensis]
MNRVIMAFAGVVLLSMGAASAQQPSAHPSVDTANNGVEAKEGENGKFVDSSDVPTYSLQEDGTADFYTWRGYKKYTANCMQCHGPDGQGSSFAPNLTDSLKRIDYYEFTGIVVGGQQNVWNTGGNSVMPAWGEDKNVMCYLDAIYIYLRARTDGVVGKGEPKRPPINEEARAAENECLGF